MTRLQFLKECNDRLIEFDIALENENILNALGNGDDQKVINILDTEF